MRKRAACSVIRRPDDGAILSVSRGHDTLDWGLPGGAVEPGELPTRAMARELREETGCVVDHRARIIPVAKNYSEAFETFFFQVDGIILVPHKMESFPFEGYPEWKQPEEMVTPACSFGRIQHELFRHLGIL
jgi:8-oxo-dGTP pyrophosphatase MutT (NUDIX family)